MCRSESLLGCRQQPAISYSWGNIANYIQCPHWFYIYILISDKQQLQELLLSPSLMRLWRTGADYYRFSSEEDGDIDVSLPSFLQPCLLLHCVCFPMCTHVLISFCFLVHPAHTLPPKPRRVWAQFECRCSPMAGFTGLQQPTPTSSVL